MKEHVLYVEKRQVLEVLEMGIEDIVGHVRL